MKGQVSTASATGAASAPRSVYEELIRQAAQAPLLHNDDTPARVRALVAERRKAEAAGGRRSA